MNDDKPKTEDTASTDDYTLQDADDNNGIVPDDALEKVNPSAAARQTPAHDPHHVVKSDKDY